MNCPLGKKFAMPFLVANYSHEKSTFGMDLEELSGCPDVLKKV